MAPTLKLLMWIVTCKISKNQTLNGGEWYRQFAFNEGWLLTLPPFFFQQVSGTRIGNCKEELSQQLVFAEYVQVVGTPFHC